MHLFLLSKSQCTDVETVKVFFRDLGHPFRLTQQKATLMQWRSLTNIVQMFSGVQFLSIDVSSFCRLTHYGVITGDFKYNHYPVFKELLLVLSTKSPCGAVVVKMSSRWGAYVLLGDIQWEKFFNISKSQFIYIFSRKVE